jgi:hypothetical protein
VFFREKQGRHRNHLQSQPSATAVGLVRVNHLSVLQPRSAKQLLYVRSARERGIARRAVRSPPPRTAKICYLRGGPGDNRSLFSPLPDLSPPSLRRRRRSRNVDSPQSSTLPRLLLPCMIDHRLHRPPRDTGERSGSDRSLGTVSRTLTRRCRGNRMHGYPDSLVPPWGKSELQRLRVPLQLSQTHRSPARLQHRLPVLPTNQ